MDFQQDNGIQSKSDVIEDNNGSEQFQELPPQRLQMIDSVDGDVISLIQMQTLSLHSRQFLMSAGYESLKTISLDDRKIVQKLQKSQSMFEILSFLRKTQVLCMQALSRRFYQILIPQYFHSVNIPLPPQFVMIDTNNREVHTYYVDENLNPSHEWTKSPLKNIDECTIQGGFKIVTTSERGGRYFICGGSKNNAKPTQYKSSPCFEFTNSGLIQKSDMVNFRTYFSLVCLVKQETHNFPQQLGSSESVSKSTSTLQCSYPSYYKVPYLYAFGGKSPFDGGKQYSINYQKIIERYDIERNEWVELKMQLTYGRVFSSAVTFSNRYIYVIGGTTNTDCFEIIDTTKEESVQKTELILLQLNTYQPWFKEIILPLDEEGLLIFCGEHLNQPQIREQSSQHIKEHYIEEEEEDEEEEQDEDYMEEEEDDIEEEEEEEYSDDESGQSDAQRCHHRFLIISNYYKTSKIQQLYKVSMKKRAITQISSNGNSQLESGRRRSGEEELKHCEALLQKQESSNGQDNLPMPFILDSFYHQYYLRERSNRENVYLLGGNFIHKMNFKERTWETWCKGNYEMA